MISDFFFWVGQKQKSCKFNLTINFWSEILSIAQLFFQKTFNRWDRLSKGAKKQITYHSGRFLDLTIPGFFRSKKKQAPAHPTSGRHVEACPAPGTSCRCPFWKPDRLPRHQFSGAMYVRFREKLTLFSLPVETKTTEPSDGSLRLSW